MYVVLELLNTGEKEVVAYECENCHYSREEKIGRNVNKIKIFATINTMRAVVMQCVSI